MSKSMRVVLSASVIFVLLALNAHAQAARRRAFGQPPPPPTPQELQLSNEMEKIRDTTLSSDYAYRQLGHLANNIGPRLSGSDGAAAAVQYVAEEFRKLGADVKIEKVMVPHWVRGEERAELVEYPGQAPKTMQKVILTALGGSVATPNDGVTAEVVTVRDINAIRKLTREQVQGKIVVYTNRYDQRMADAGESFSAYGIGVTERAVGASEAARLGAVAAVIRSVGGANYRLTHTGAMFYLPDVAKIPAAAATSEDIDTIAALAQEGKVRMHLVLTPQTLPDVESANVVADIRGSEHPEEIVVVGGHLDSWDLGRGAIDDGSGVSSAMQVIATIKQLGLKPKRTIRAIAFMNEENGGRGSAGYVKDHDAEIKNHVGAIEMDNGAGHAMGFVAHASADSIAKLQLAAGALHEQGADIIRYTPNAPGSDIGGLDQRGVPSFAPLNDGRKYFDYHHTPADTFDKIDKLNLQENASVLTVLSWYLANAETRPVQADPPKVEEKK
jgi:Zn-dependent M28 family amino/carboxypeptidase